MEETDGVQLPACLPFCHHHQTVQVDSYHRAHFPHQLVQLWQQPLHWLCINSPTQQTIAKSWQPQAARRAVWELFTHLKRPQPLQRRRLAPSPLEVSLSVIRPVWFVVNMNTKVLVTIQHVHPLRPDGNWSRGRPVSPIIHHHLLGFADVELEMFGSPPELYTPPPLHHW